MITIRQNEDYTKYLHLQYADSAEPVDLSQIDGVYSELRDRPNGTLKATGTCTVTAASGDIRVEYSAAQTLALPLGEYGFDVWIVENDRNHPIYTTRINIIGRYTQDLGGE